MVETVMAFSPTERQIDFYGCEIGVSRQWYNEATAILTEINEGKYLKVPEGAVALTAEERDEEMREYNRDRAEIEERVRKKTAKEILQVFENLLELIKDNDDAKVLLNHIEILRKECGVKKGE